MPTKKVTKVKRNAEQYDDPSHNYVKYWEGREYENAAEELAIRRLLRGLHFKKAIDVGGGYGRLCLLLRDFADDVSLVEPSSQQLELAKDYLKEHPEIHRLKMQASDLKFDNNSVDLITFIRVMHHLPDPEPELRELARILSDDGYLILEVANYTHFRNRLKYLIKGKRLPMEPVDIRSAKNKRKEEIPFVNHNPKKVRKQLAHAGLMVERVLSVSNLRSPQLKKILPKSLMVGLEDIMQVPLAKSYFGPSVFFLVKKAK